MSHTNKHQEYLTIQAISEVAIDVENAAELLRERKVDFED